jgi:hypothetical protein
MMFLKSPSSLTHPVFCVMCCALQFQKYIGSEILSAITHTQILEL